MIKTMKMIQIYLIFLLTKFLINLSLKFENGNVYAGTWKSGNRHGKGK